MVKTLLIFGLLAATYLALNSRPSATRLALTRIATVIVFALGVVAILLPSRVTSVANALGVGRGADLVLYVLTITFLLTAVGLYKKLQDLEDRYVEVVRHLALLRATNEHLRLDDKATDQPRAEGPVVAEKE